MALPVLKINLGQINNHRGTLGYDYIICSLRDSGLFEIQDHQESVRVVKGDRGTILYFNDKKIYLDFWEYSAPTHNPEVLNAKFDLIIKLQHKLLPEKDYIEFIRNKNMFLGIDDLTVINFYRKIIPWTFFPSKNMMPYIGKEEELINKLEPKQIGFFCGKNWKARHSMKSKLDKEGIEYISTEVRGAKIPDSDFLDKMMSSKFGIVLPGRCTRVSDSKNRREIDYMMMKKPLLISYRPYYYDPLVEGKHYIYINDKTDFKTLENMYNIKEMVENAFAWYQNNASRLGIAQSFLKIMTDKGYIV